MPVAQRRLWPKLEEVGPNFVLYGGTALSLQVGGRISIDFDFFTADPIDHLQLGSGLAILRGARLQQGAANTATFIVGSGEESVAISFFGGMQFGRVSDQVRFSGNGVYAAGLLDLAAQKVRVVQQRAESKDYQDIHTLLNQGIAVAEMLGAAQAIYPGFNPTITLKALTYFADVPDLAADVQKDLIEAAARVRSIPEISLLENSITPRPIAPSQPFELDGLIPPPRSKGQDLEPDI